MPRNELTIENYKVFSVVFFLFLISVLVIILSLIKSKKASIVESNITPVEVVVEENGVPLSDYFKDKEFSKSGDSDSKNPYLQSDPFQSTCLSDGSGKKPYVVSGTVCYY